MRGYLRELISGTEARLENLRKKAFQIGEEIVFEETVLSSTEKELRRLEQKVFIGQKGKRRNMISFSRY